MADYITDAELLSYGIALDSLSGIAEATRDAHRLAASSTVASFLLKRYELPLTAVSDDIKFATAAIASWSLLCLRGYNPQNGRDNAVLVRRNEAIAWLESVVRGETQPEAVAASGTPNYQRGPLVESDTQRDWSYPRYDDEDYCGGF